MEEDDDDRPPLLATIGAELKGRLIEKTRYRETKKVEALMPAGVNELRKLPRPGDKQYADLSVGEKRIAYCKDISKAGAVFSRGQRAKSTAIEHEDYAMRVMLVRFSGCAGERVTV